MARIVWDEVGNRHYQIGVDRTVLYVDGYEGVAWNGITGIDEAPIGGTQTPYYMDGVKYLSVTALEEYAATIKALSTPELFGLCDGTVSVHRGLFATHQPRKPFGLTYRTLVGNDTEGSDYGYQIHLVYNATANPSTRANNTVSRTPTPVALSYPIEAIPERPFGVRPTAHLVVDSRDSNKMALAYLEAILYGTLDTSPRLPTVSELQDIFGWDLPEYDGPINIRGMWDSAEKTITNLFTRPSFESESGKVVRRRNLCTNPGLEVNQTGWTAVNGEGSSLARVSTRAHSGRFSAEYTRGTAVTSASGPGFANMTVGAGETYTFSVWVYSESVALSQGYRMCAFGSALSTTVRGVVSDVIGEWTRISLTVTTVAAGQVVCFVGMGVSVNASGEKLWIDDLLIEKTAQPIGYFDGNTPSIRAKSYEWEGPPNASTSIEYTPTMVEIAKNLFTNPNLVGDGTWAEVRRNKFINPRAMSLTSFSGSPGTGGAGDLSTGTATGRAITDLNLSDPSEVRYVSTTPPTGGYSRLSVERIAVTPGEPISVGAYVRGSNSSKYRITIDWQDASGAYLSLETGAWVQQGYPGSGTGTDFALHKLENLVPPANAAYAKLFAMKESVTAGQWVSVAVLWSDDSSDLGPFFDGSTPDFSVDPDMRQRWLGTPNASESVMEIERVRGLTATNCVAGVSTWEGRSAVRQIPTGPDGSNAYFQTPIPVAARTGGTLLGTMHLVAPITGTLHMNFGKIRAQSPNNDSVSPPNESGSYPQRVEYSALTLNYQATFFHGGSRGSGDVYWSKPTLIAGQTDNRIPGFDGDTIPDDIDWTCWWNEDGTCSIGGVAVPGVSGYNAWVIRSSHWSLENNYSSRIIPNSSSSSDSFMVLPNLPAGSLREKATLLSVIHLNQSQVGLLSNRSRSLGALNPEQIASLPPNEPGEYLQRITWYDLVTGTNRLYNGARLNGGDVYWDLLTLTEDEYDGPPFSGETEIRWLRQLIQADWDGTPNNSTSSFTHLVNPPPITTYGDAYIVNGNLWVLNSEMLWQNLGDDLPPLT